MAETNKVVWEHLWRAQDRKCRGRFRPGSGVYHGKPVVRSTVTRLGTAALASAPQGPGTWSLSRSASLFSRCGVKETSVHPQAPLSWLGKELLVWVETGTFLFLFDVLCHTGGAQETLWGAGRQTWVGHVQSKCLTLSLRSVQPPKPGQGWGDRGEPEDKMGAHTNTDMS